MRRVLASTAEQPVRIWIALAWSGVLVRDIPRVRAEQLRLDADPPAVVMPDGTVIELLPLTFAELTAAALPTAGLLTRRADGQPMSQQHIASTAAAWLRRSGVTASLYEIARRPSIRDRLAQ